MSGVRICLSLLRRGNVAARGTMGPKARVSPGSHRVPETAAGSADPSRSSSIGSFSSYSPHIGGQAS
ncbi:hypothetical protein GCM10023191_020500 [Actinoallomurus oryzae]|uniref:Uncharacterized protein n=1 Tax=Actinoallomurus oryzae TaxID=502180 RepID=A0ABP8PQ35_9ACTN